MDVFLNHTAGHWKRGVNDCYIAVADQIKDWTGVDLMADCRGFTSFHGMLRLVRKAGYPNPDKAMTARLEQHGWQVVNSPFQDRDIGAIGFVEDGIVSHAPAIFHDGMWHVRGKGGWLAFETEIDMAWRRGQCR